MYLADTNIFLEAILQQERATEVELFFQTIDLNIIFMTDFSLHSIGIILFKHRKHPLFRPFVEDVVIQGISVLSLTLEDLKILDRVTQKFILDFDDAYQYTVSKKYNLQLVSFDQDFDQTDIERKEPVDLLK